jgi:hypothetical protein
MLSCTSGFDCSRRRLGGCTKWLSRCAACITTDPLCCDHAVARVPAYFFPRLRAAMTTPPFDDSPPVSARVTPYDERHFVTYLRLLDAAAEGADWREAVRIVFDIDPEREPERARLVHDSHLARARWMTDNGYRHLLRPPLN